MSFHAGISKRNTSGFVGVSLYKPNGKYVAYLTVCKRFIKLGYFDVSPGPTAGSGLKLGKYLRVFYRYLYLPAQQPGSTSLGGK